MIIYLEENKASSHRKDEVKIINNRRLSSKSNNSSWSSSMKISNNGKKRKIVKLIKKPKDSNSNFHKFENNDFQNQPKFATEETPNMSQNL